MDYKYVSIEEKRKKTEKSIDKLKKKNIELMPIKIVGTKIAKNWWGKAWNKNLESYSDFSNRISRGRSYVRNGSVIDLKINNGSIDALVQGTKARPYKIKITIKPLEKKVWDEIVKECSGKVESLEQLIEGKFPKELEILFTNKGNGLFPSPKEISFDCSCPDYAYMCKHIAAVLYGIGARLDEDPSLFFTLRNVNIDDLITRSISEKTQNLITQSETKSKRILEDDVLDMFDVDIDKK